MTARYEQAAVGSKAWFERRAALWREDAEALTARLREYEECHPSVRDGVPCLRTALEAAEAALTASVGKCGRCGKGDHGDHPWDCLDGKRP